MPTLRRRLRRRGYALLARAVLMAACVVPQAPGRAFGRMLSRLAFRIRPADVDLARRNLALAFPDRDTAWRERIVDEATARLGENLHDALTLRRRARRGFDDVTDDGARAVLRDLAAEGNGVLILTGHFGCWELLGAWLAHVMGELTVVTGVVRNPAVDRLLNDRRRALGLNPVPRDGDLRPLLRALRSGGAAALLMDQNVKSESVDVPFCGTPAPTAVGLARLARRTGSPILPLAIGRDGHGHRVIHQPPLRAEDHDGYSDERALLAACNGALERFLARNPAEWVWFHDRWPHGAAPDRKDDA